MKIDLNYLNVGWAFSGFLLSGFNFGGLLIGFFLGDIVNDIIEWWVNK